LAYNPQTVETSDLAQHIRGVVYENYKTNRQKLEVRWSRNRAAAEVDLELDEYGKWKKSENAEDWQSDTLDDTTHQKIAAAKALISDTAFKGGNVQFMLVPPEGAETDPVAVSQRDPVIKANENYISRQLTNCNAVVELGKCVMSGATYGRYFAKQYTTAMESGNGFVQIAENIFEESISDTTTMAFENVSVFNMLWDMEADDLIEGEAVMQTDLVSPFMLREDAFKPYHFKKYIKAAIKASTSKYQASGSGQDTQNLPTRLRDIANRNRTIHQIEFWGRVPRKMADAFEDMLARDLDVEDPKFGNRDDLPEDSGDMVEIFAILADDYIIAYNRTNDKKERPYFMGDWEEVLDGNCGRGVADNLYQIAKTLTGTRRAIEDNMALASTLILAFKRSLIQEDIEKEIGSDKRIITLALDEMDSRTSAIDAVQQVKVDSIIDELTKLLTMNIEFADMASSIPRAEQGQQSSNPQTAFELQQRLERSGKYMGEVIRRLDKFIETIINEFYRYNMLDPDIPVQKGIYQVKALGFSSFENKVIKLQKMLQYFAMVIDRPEMLKDVNIRWLHEEIAKSMDMDIAQLLKTQEQKDADAQAEAEAQANSPDMQAFEMDQQAKAAKIEKDKSAIEADQSSIAKDQSDIDKNAHDMLMEEEQLKIDRAEAVAGIQTKATEVAQKKKESQ